jgi:diguanylate cyclase (GGDEF)-like protein
LLRLELMHLLALGAAIPAFLFLIAKVQLLHHILHRASRKIKNIQEDAQRDTLLGCFNRRYIVAALEEQRQVADETGIPLCLAVIDLDHFKRINDELGHLGGDEVLRHFARVAQENVRAGDIFGRYGGRSFADLSRHLAAARAQHLRAHPRPGRGARLEGLLRGKVTVSIGVTQYVPGESVLEFFSRADTATYLAKEGGRNQVVVEEPTRKGDPSVTVEPIPDEEDDLEPEATLPPRWSRSGALLPAGLISPSRRPNSACAPYSASRPCSAPTWRRWNGSKPTSPGCCWRETAFTSSKSP